MNIIEALKSEWNIRVSYSNRWLIWDKTIEAWVVYGREYAQEETGIVTTRNEEKAIKYLLYQEEA